MASNQTAPLNRGALASCSTLLEGLLHPNFHYRQMLAHRVCTFCFCQIEPGSVSPVAGPPPTSGCAVPADLEQQGALSRHERPGNEVSSMQVGETPLLSAPAPVFSELAALVSAKLPHRITRFFGGLCVWETYALVKRS